MSSTLAKSLVLPSLQFCRLSFTRAYSLAVNGGCLQIMIYLTVMYIVAGMADGENAFAAA